MKKKNIIFAISSAFSVPLMALTTVSCGSSPQPEKQVDFSKDTWANVVSKANEGFASLKEYYGINSFLGLEREIEVFGATHKVRVIGQNEDYLYSKSSSKKAALTFQFSTILSKKNGDEIEAIRMPLYKDDIGQDNTTSRWENSDVRNWLNSDEDGSLKKQLMSILGDKGLKVVNKNSIQNLLSSTETISSLQESIFLLSLGDIYTLNKLPDDHVALYYDESNETDGGVGAYSYFVRNIADGYDFEDPINILTLPDGNGINQPYWLRTGNPEIIDLETYRFCGQWAIGNNGACSQYQSDIPWPTDSDIMCLAPCFCI